MAMIGLLAILLASLIFAVAIGGLVGFIIWTLLVIGFFFLAIGS